MTTPTYTSPFTGTVVQQTDVTYNYIKLPYSIRFYWNQTAPNNEYSLTRILDLESVLEGIYAVLPPANEGAVGTDCLITNRGGFAITVYSSNYYWSWNIEPGKSVYFYLNQNDTVDGYWETVDFGSTTSIASAVALAGAGLYVRNAALNVGITNQVILNPPTLTDSSACVNYIWEGGAGIIYLPAAGILSAGWFIAFRNNGTGTLVFQAQGTSLINKGTTFTANPGDSGFIMFNSNTNNFVTVGVAPANVVALTSSVYDVDVISTPLDLTSYAPIIQTYKSLSGTRTTNLSIELPPITQLYVFQNVTGSSAYDLSFNVTGSVGTPVTVANNTIVTAITDGNNIYPVSSVAITGSFIGVNGSAGAPTFSFTNDTTTGMYLENPSILAFTVGGVKIMTIDNSNPAAPQVRINGELIATNISGGTF